MCALLFGRWRRSVGLRKAALWIVQLLIGTIEIGAWLDGHFFIFIISLLFLFSSSSYKQFLFCLFSFIPPPSATRPQKVRAHNLRDQLDSNIVLWNCYFIFFPSATIGTSDLLTIGKMGRCLLTGRHHFDANQRLWIEESHSLFFRFVFCLVCLFCVCNYFGGPLSMMFWLSINDWTCGPFPFIGKFV